MTTLEEIDTNIQQLESQIKHFFATQDSSYYWDMISLKLLKDLQIAHRCCLKHPKTLAGWLTVVFDADPTKQPEGYWLFNGNTIAAIANEKLWWDNVLPKDQMNPNNLIQVNNIKFPNTNTIIDHVEFRNGGDVTAIPYDLYCKLQDNEIVNSISKFWVLKGSRLDILLPLIIRNHTDMFVIAPINNVTVKPVKHKKETPVVTNVEYF